MEVAAVAFGRRVGHFHVALMDHHPAAQRPARPPTTVAGSETWASSVNRSGPFADVPETMNCWAPIQGGLPPEIVSLGRRRPPGGPRRR